MANDQIHQKVCGLVLTNQFELGLEYNRLPQFDGVVLL